MPPVGLVVNTAASNIIFNNMKERIIIFEILSNLFTIKVYNLK